MSDLSLAAFRNQFPVTNHYVYFMAPAVTALPTPAREAIERFVGEMTDDGCTREPAWVRHTERTRERAARLLGAPPQQVAFVQNTSAGLSLLAEGLPLDEGDRVAVPEGEFPSNVYPWMNQQHRGVVVDRIPSGPEGEVLSEAIRKAVREDTRVLAVSSVQFHNGYRIPLDQLAEFQTEDRYVVVDGIQSVGWDELDLAEAPVDALVADAHKWMCGPEGIGVMYLSERLLEELRPVLVGWKSVQDAFLFEENFVLREDAARLEPGSSNHLGVYGLYESLSLLARLSGDHLRRHCFKLRGQAVRELNERGFSVVGESWPEANRSPILAVRPPGEHDAETLANQLAERNIEVSARRGALRAGFHGYNNESDVRKWMDALDELL